MALSNWLTDEQLKDLLRRYFDGQFHKDDNYAIETMDLIKRIQNDLLDTQVIDSLSENEFLKYTEELYREVVSVPMYYKVFSRNLDAVRTAFRYLIKSDDDLATKVNALLNPDGGHRIAGLGRSYWSIIIRALDPQNNPRWTHKTEKALIDLGINFWEKNDPAGRKYTAITQAQKDLIELSDCSEADLYTIDHFMHYVTVLEGKDILQDWKKILSKATLIVIFRRFHSICWKVCTTIPIKIFIWGTGMISNPMLKNP